MGRPSKGESVDDEQILRYIATDRRPAVGTGDVASEFDFSTQNATERLRRLAADGALHHDKVSGVNLWWLSQDGRDRLADA